MTGTSTTAPETTPSASVGFRVVQRTLLRADQELDVRPLYVSGVSGFGAGDTPAATRQSGSGQESEDSEDSNDVTVQPTVPGLAGYGEITEAGHAVANQHRRLTFATYFNAFPASYWRRWTDFASVRLIAKVRGQGNFIIYRSTAKGHVLRVEAARISTDETQTLEFDLSLKPFIDGGWYWFDIEAEDSAFVLEEAVWGFETDKVAQGRISIGITTFNRPDFCVDQLLNLATADDVLAILDEVVVVDQGTQRVHDEPRFPQAAAALGDKLRMLQQDNLGGSGGFSRAMNEAASRGNSDYVLLLDDDVVCELEGILRGVAMADLARKPVLVGGQMFSLYDRTVMHAFGETLARWKWFWGPAPGTYHGHDFSRNSLRSTSWLHRRIDVDYNGWWMCLIPTRVVREVGLSLPMFIKWDDAEFGLRAAEAGFPTVTLPGVAVWHVPWTEKDDTLDWQAYFHQRNRVISGLLHSPYERGGRLVLESFENLAKRAVSMQYSTAETILLALQDVLAGPERMHRDMTYRLQELRELRQHFTDSRLVQDLEAFPAPRRKKPPRGGQAVSAPTGPVGMVRTAAASLLRQLRTPRDLAAEHPEALVPHVDHRWWRLAQMDSSIVSSADGTSAAWYKRDRAKFLELMRRSSALHAQLYREWPALSQRYRQAVADLAAPETWKQTFEGLDDELGAGALPAEFRGAQ
ncbi:MAG TPA: glycosyltransferase [Marmoricola sp.]